MFFLLKTARRHVNVSTFPPDDDGNWPIEVCMKTGREVNVISEDPRDNIEDLKRAFTHFETVEELITHINSQHK